MSTQSQQRPGNTHTEDQRDAYWQARRRKKVMAPHQKMKKYGVLNMEVKCTPDLMY